MVDELSLGALAQPTRARLFALLQELGRPAGTAELAELAEQLGLHANGVRLHLARLQEDGLLVRSSDPRPRGRPRDSWWIAPDAQPGGPAPRAYGDLGRWLARSLGASGRSLRSIEGTGREIGRELARGRDTSGSEGFHSAMATLGFQPEMQTDQQALKARLRNCPYCDAVQENQPAVCTLHRGITRGLLDELLPTARLTSFEPHDPQQAGCTIEVTRPAGTAASTGTKAS